jgi:zinc transporter ZupT
LDTFHFSGNINSIYIIIIYRKTSRKSTRLLGFINAFSGGIFLGIGLFQLLPESRELIEEHVKTSLPENWQGMPWAFFITFGAYSFMLLVEKIMFSTQSIIPLISAQDGHGAHGHAHGDHHEHKDEESEHIHADSETSSDQEDSDEEEETIKNVVSTKGKFASFLQVKNCTK